MFTKFCFVAAFVLSVPLALFSNGVLAQNPIVLENQKAGTRAWKISQSADDSSSQIKGYADRLSVNTGDTIRFHVSVNPAQKYTITVYRMGFYQGLGGREVRTIGPTGGVTQARCPVDASTGQTTCAWASGTALTIPQNWTSGIYIAKLVNARGFENHVPFVVKSPTRRAALLYQQPITTYHAYNNYPNDGFTGKSTYDRNSFGANTVSGRLRAVRVSFDRPLADKGSYLYFQYEHELVMYLEEQGYDVDYITDVDMHLFPGLVTGRKGFISGGHDEYWTREKRSLIETARNGGLDLAFFGANASFWQIKLKPDGSGRPARVMEVYKDFNRDPEPIRDRKTVTFRSIGKAEQALLGVQYIDYGNGSTVSSFVAQNTNHWIYNNTGVSDNHQVPGIIGGEVDTLFAQYPRPVSTEYTVLGRSPFVGQTQGQVEAQTTIYRAPSGAWVFASGTLRWNRGLNDPRFRDPTIRQMTSNLLDRFVDSSPGVTPTTPTLTASAAPIAEGGGDLRVMFTLSEASSSPVSFKVATRSGGASPGVDYYGTFRTFTFAPGNTQITFSVQVIDDTISESTERFALRTFDIVGAEPAQFTSELTIIDDDNTASNVTLRVDDMVVPENNGRAWVAITLSAALTRSINVDFADSTGGTATRGSDYYGTYKRLVIPSGTTRISVPVTILNDSTVEPSEEIRVQIFNSPTVTLGRANGVIRILDDD